MIINFIITVECSKSSGNADVEKVDPTKEQTTEHCRAPGTNNEGLTFSSQILFISS